jgi:hypothetical protein
MSAAWEAEAAEWIEEGKKRGYAIKLMDSRAFSLKEEAWEAAWNAAIEERYADGWKMCASVGYLSIFSKPLEGGPR